MSVKDENKTKVVDMVSSKGRINPTLVCRVYLGVACQYLGSYQSLLRKSK